MPLAIQDASIVAIGSFNPPIVSVDWLAKHELIGAEDALGAKESSDFVVSRQISSFSTNAVKLQVTENQLSISSVGPVMPVLSDLAMSILQLLPHTPVTAIGINFMVHYKMPSDDMYHGVGDKVAPKEIWEQIFPNKAIGLTALNLRVQDGTRAKPSTSPNAKNIALQPSGKIPNGVYLSINNHYAIATDGQQLKVAGDAADIVRNNWDSDFKESLLTFARIIEQTAGKEAL